MTTGDLISLARAELRNAEKLDNAIATQMFASRAGRRAAQATRDLLVERILALQVLLDGLGAL